MLFVPIEQLKEGMIVDKDVFGTLSSAQHTVLLMSKGNILSERTIKKLRQYQVLGLYIYYPGTKDIEIEEAIPASERLETLGHLKNMFNTIESNQYISLTKSITEIKGKISDFIDFLNQKDAVMIDVLNLKNHDDCTFNHSVNVSIVTLAIGIQLDFSKKQLEELGLAAILHDIGKLNIPLPILNKPGKLTDDEFNVIKQHPDMGWHHLVSTRVIPFTTCQAVQSHHERFDGTGYPNRISKQSIPYFARILAIADVYDALTSVRPYRKPATPNEAIDYMLTCSGSHFDPELLNCFLKIIAPYPVGSCIGLSSGQTAVVLQLNKSNPQRPIVRLLKTGRDIDLATDANYQNVTIIGMDYQGLQTPETIEV